MKKGVVVWITGLSGAGKSSIAREVCRQLQEAGKNNVVFLDGDAIREVCGNDLGHTPDERLINAQRLSRLCRLLSEQGLHVVCATMSLFKTCHNWNREHLSHYYEVLIQVPLDVLKKRDSRQIYSRAARGEITGVVGLDIDAEMPQNPHITVDNSLPAKKFDNLASEIIRSIPEFHENN